MHAIVSPTVNIAVSAIRLAVPLDVIEMRMVFSIVIRVRTRCAVTSDTAMDFFARQLLNIRLLSRVASGSPAVKRDGTSSRPEPPVFRAYLATTGVAERTTHGHDLDHELNKKHAAAGERRVIGTLTQTKQEDPMILKTAKMLGLTIPQSVLMRADEVIE